ncbi:putative secretion protein (HlyD family); toxin/protease secretion system [Bradyrhizobium sp. STM 3843]|uniref:HlyD family type I secretion periplasmic adaptor subunit n=1 Tax=Bradyrhizobium sp. STM 3843 TaxID=551947 RepID=UPI000240ADCA|nr:HlyD family type I secretion periplasmic adaptor subunit [Bradyrhizobium sp. STM 3843]CCE05099.1 putative secretion protein (HlyD family); toxin/protease secretion system [Bradyrhizobium sp. STM 3843]
MKHVNELRPYDENDPNWRGMPRSRTVGPQGDALILELQRLQNAFDDDEPDDPRTRRGSREDARKGRRPAPAGGRKKAPQRVAKRKKGKVGRAFDISLSLFGLSPARAPQRRPDTMRENRPAWVREPEITPPQRPRSMAPNDAAPPMNFRAVAPTLDLRSEGSQRSRSLAPAQVPALAEPQTKMGRLVGTASVALTTGMTFIASQGTAAQLDDPSGEALIPRVGFMFENELRTGLRVLLVAGVLGGGWLTLVPLAGAVVVPGNLVVQSDVKAIQHPTGGVVAAIKVENGTHVAAGDLLVRLDATQTQAALQTITKQLNEQRAKIARLTAERDGKEQPEYPSELTSRTDDANVRAVIASENSLFKARLLTRQSQKDLLQGRIAQLNQEIAGMEAQADSKSKQIELINGELAGVQDLYDKRLVPLTRLTTLQREAARIDGERGQLTSSVAETRSKINEAELQIVKTDQDFRTEVVKDLGEAQAKEGELIEKGVAGRDQLDRIEIRAPNSGTVHQLSVHTIGGVVKAGETIMEVVPDSDELQVEAHVQPKDIDHVHTGQDAFVRFSAFNSRTTPQVTGQVSFVSPDITTDQRSNSTFYTVRVVMSDDERHRLGNVQLIPGMQAEVFVQTGKRTMLSYLMKPIMEQWRRAFVEE